MFMMAAAFIDGKQGKAEFRQGLNATNVAARDIINNVGDGYFPSAGGFKCEIDVAGALQFSAGANVQGTNQACVFMGKVVELNAANYSIYTVAGKREFKNPGNGVLQAPTSFENAKPAVAPSLTETKPYDYGVQLVRATNHATPIKRVGFFTGFGNYASGAGSTYQAGSGIVVVPLTDGASNTSDQILAMGNSSPPPAVPDPAPNIVLCFDGGNGQFGTITIGGSGGGQRLATKAQIYNSQAEANAAAPGTC